MNYKTLSGREISRPILERIKLRIKELRAAGWTPRLASIEIGSTPASVLYIRNQRRLCADLEIEFENRNYSHNITQAEMLAAIEALNVDPRISGIILQRPVPAHLNLEDLQNAIHVSKDVEGMNSSNIGKVVYGDFMLGPCTSLASMEILRTTGLTLQGLDAVVVGHSEVVGKPLALYLMEELVTVTICHHGTRDLRRHTRQADAVLVAVGKPGLITGDMIKPGAAVIDIGINLITVTDKDGKLKQKTVGDVDFDSVSEVAGWITPVPGGVGPVTLAMLMRNVITALDRQKRRYESMMRP